MCSASGFPQAVPDAAERAARVALAFSRDAERAGVRLRSALHVGEVYAALVGTDALSFWVWGDGIDLARRLALSADRGRIGVSSACYTLLSMPDKAGSAMLHLSEPLSTLAPPLDQQKRAGLHRKVYANGLILKRRRAEPVLEK